MTRLQSLLRSGGRLIAPALGAFVALAAAAAAPVPAEPSDPKAKRELLRVSAALDKAEVAVGEKVTLTESVPITLDTVVGSMTHHATIIGDWDKERKELILLNPGKYRLDWPETGLPGLVSTLRVQTPPSDFDGSLGSFRTRERKGTTFTFKPEKPGIYLITARWHHQREADDVYYISNPVVLMVKGK